MNMKETAAVLGESSALIGIVSEPAEPLSPSPPSDRPAVVLAAAEGRWPEGKTAFG